MEQKKEWFLLLLHYKPFLRLSGVFFMKAPDFFLYFCPKDIK
ncbi:MAG: hypothetical protein ACOC36_03175 [Fibrobacterota bacterium]